MKIIYKYHLADTGINMISMPATAEILSVGNQNGRLILWALVETETSEVKRKFSVLLTGHEIANEMIAADFIGTVQLGFLVFHVFDHGWRPRGV